MLFRSQHGLLGDAAAGAPRAEPHEKMLDQGRNVLLAVLEGRQVDIEHVQAVKKGLAEDRKSVV